MRSFNVATLALATCLAACGARSGLQCLGDVCVPDVEGGAESSGAAGASSTPFPPTPIPPTPVPPRRTPPTGSTGRAVEAPEENDWMRAPPDSPPISPQCAQSSTWRGSIVVTTREELEQLAGCERIDGDLIVSGLRSRDLSPLSSLRLVSGTLELSLSGSLVGLERLTRVGHLTLTDLDVPTLEPLLGLNFVSGGGGEDGRLTIQRSQSLQNLSGLASLREVGSIELSENPGLASLDGLRVPPHLRELLIASNPNLRALGGLADLRSFDRLELRDNASLVRLRGLEGVVSGASLHISNSPALRDMTALSQLGSLGSLLIDTVGMPNLDRLVALRDVRDVVLQRNPNLTQVDVLARLAGLEDLVVTENPSLLRLPNFPEVPSMERVLIRANAALASGPGFPRLVETASLHISDNPRLTRIVGFPELRSVRSVNVSDNRDLLEVDLSALEDVGRLRILCNPNLPEASLSPLLPLGDVDFRGNLGSSSSCGSGGPG